MRTLGLRAVRRALDATVAEAEARQVRISVVVVDSRGEVLGSARMDGAPGFTHSIARDKARTCALMSTDSAGLAQLATDHPGLLDHVSDHAGFRVTTLAGGVVLHDGDTTIGAIGVSGAHPDDDVLCAQAALGELLGSGDRP